MNTRSVDGDGDVVNMDIESFSFDVEVDEK
jgi:hypothetical protein